MTIKRILFRSIVRSLEFITLLQKPRKIINFPRHQDAGLKDIDIIVVAFNNPELIRYQYQLIKKYVSDDYTYMVADNSTNLNDRKIIETFCEKNQLVYISLPNNFMKVIGPSYSHAVSLNYICHKILSKRQSYAYAFLDHDIFPIKPYSIVQHLDNQSIYGVLRERGSGWYLWPGMAFFRYDVIRPEQLDFMPIQIDDAVYMDTGGGNWLLHYQYIQRKNIFFPKVEQVSFREGDDYHGDTIQYIDERAWLHTINGSCWKQVAEGKDDIIRELLNQYC